MTEQKKKQFFLFLILSTVILFVYHLASRVNSYNATMLAFSYKYGFISRGLIGTIYQGIDRILPIDMMRYEVVNGFVLIVTILYCISVLAFLHFILKSIYSYTSGKEQTWNPAWGLVIFFLIFAIPTFAGYYNFGRLDLYLMMISMIALVLLIKDKALWMLIPLAGMGMMIHEGYVFMYVNIILVLLLYKGCHAKENERCEAGVSARTGSSYNRYLWIFLAVFFVVSCLFVYFHFFSHFGGKEVYDEIVEVANGMSYKNKCHKDVVRAEILGVDLTAEEWEYHLQNFIELPIFCLLMLPFIYILVLFFRNVFAKVRGNKIARLKYGIVMVGALTTLPLFIMKVDYGRWCFAVIMYYCLMMMAMMAMGDEIVWHAWQDALRYIENKWTFARYLLVYAVFLTPLCDLSICKFSYLIYSLPDKLMKMLG